MARGKRRRTLSTDPAQARLSPARFVSGRELGESERFREEYGPVRAELEGGYEVSMFRHDASAG